MHRLAVAVAPLLVGSVFAVADLLLGPTQVVLGLVVIAPLLAASVVGWRLTAAYGIGALATAVVLGVFDDQYTSENWVAQSVRIVGVTAGSILALVACSARLRRERRMRQLTAAPPRRRLTYSSPGAGWATAPTATADPGARCGE